MKTTTSRTLSSLFAAFAFFTGSAALAATQQADMAISASVTNSCTISAGSLAFGAYDPTSATDNTNSGTFTIKCTNGAAATLMLGQGSNADTGSTDDSPMRRMKAGSNYLAYSLFSDSGRTTAWGNTSGTGKGTTGTGANENHTFYGTMAAGQNAPAGSYTDTVTATVEF